ncbi:6-bladed beta-propeller [Algoriphagus aquimarinus]|uniref:6-bladed beta-propeller n=1 Tax=Algoriphagus aquimarinus TaxID=237018 RepID=UPI0030D9356F|tara:strand:- start:37607 stop:38683 length:1077 start_codon:yes stop_codon:yes gene_type:complete
MKKGSKLFCLRLSLSLLSLFALSCSSPKSSELETFDIPKEGESEFQLSDLTESIEYIALETNEESFLRLIQDVKFYKDKIYVVDFPGKILVFDRKGKFLNQLGKTGKGPGEFSNVASFVIDERSETAHIASGRRLISYTLDNEYIGEKKMPFFIDYLDMVDNSLSLIAAEDGVKSGDKFVNRRSLFKLDKNLTITDSIPLLHIELNQQTGASYPYKNYISKLDGEDFIYTPVLIDEPIIRDTLYRFDDNVLIPFIKLNFASPSLNEEGSKLIVIKNVMLSANYLLCEYNREGSSMFYIGNRNKDFSVNISDGFLIEDEEVVTLRPFDLSNDQFYFIKTYNFSDVSEEELNPIIGIVSL